VTRARILELTGALDAHAAEALALEIRRLAREHGVEVTITPMRMESAASVRSSPSRRMPPPRRRRDSPPRRRSRAGG
jgi:type IV pilus biogenesis protein CpaD/CtpE